MSAQMKENCPREDKGLPSGGQRAVLGRAKGCPREGRITQIRLTFLSCHFSQILYACNNEETYEGKNYGTGIVHVHLFGRNE